MALRGVKIFAKGTASKFMFSYCCKTNFRYSSCWIKFLFVTIWHVLLFDTIWQVLNKRNGKAGLDFCSILLIKTKTLESNRMRSERQKCFQLWPSTCSQFAKSYNIIIRFVEHVSQVFDQWSISFLYLPARKSGLQRPIKRPGPNLVISQLTWLVKLNPHNFSCPRAHLSIFDAVRYKAL